MNGKDIILIKEQNMTAYSIVIEEILRKEITVTAKTEEEAFYKVTKMYDNEEIILSADDWISTEISN